MRYTKQKKKNTMKHISTVLCLLTVISLLFSGIPQPGGLAAYGAVAPALNIATGSQWKYTESGRNVYSVSYSTASPETSKMNITQGSTGISIEETEANKLYELGYVPIITSMTVPANTTYQTTFTFKAEGNKNGTGTALAVMEIYDFGSSDSSSGLTFNMANNDTYSSAYTKLRTKTTGSSLSGTYTVTVSYANTSSSEKTVYHYFGFFAGVHYGSSKNHRLQATCSITSSRIVDGNTTVPSISASSSNLWHYISSNASSSTLASSKFIQEKDSITLDEANGMGIPFNGYNANQYWPNRAGLTIGTNKLTLKDNGGLTSSSHMTYATFSVPITVPAHMTRTYYLNFTIDYDRNTGSGAGFFAELIQGDVPQAFNTDTTSSMTGNTKLRVYSTSGSVHSGSVEIPITLTNDTDSPQIHSEPFVFFVGYRKVGVYTPNPTYNLTLTDISYASYENDYGVIVNAQNCTYTAPNKVGTGENCTATFKANTGYTLPAAVTVKVGNTTLPSSNYTWNKSTGQLTIQAKYITDTLTITASGVPNTYAITYSGLDGAALTTKPATHTYGTATTVGNPTKTGYVFDGWKVNGSGSAQKNLTLGAAAYTGNISLEATWSKAKYSATLSGTNVSASSGFGTQAATYTTAWTGTFTATAGYVLPDSISVTVDGKTLDSSNYTYTKSTGTVSINAAYVTGNIAVIVDGHKHSYAGNVTTPATCTTEGEITYTCTCGDSYTEPIPATGHDYEEPVWHWTGVTAAQATFTCKNDPNHTATETAQISSSITEEANCTDNGLRTYTASVSFNNRIYTDKVTEPIPFTGHNWSSQWSWDEVQHWYSCVNAGCTAEREKADHSFEWVIDKEPEGNTAGLKHEECTVCKYAKNPIEYNSDIINVEISWGDLAFTYSEGGWNPKTHTYDNGGWMPEETGGSKITAENTGDIEVSVSFSYIQAYDAVTGSFTDGENPVTDPISLPVGEKKQVWLLLVGKPNQALNNQVLGSVTVTIGGE